MAVSEGKLGARGGARRGETRQGEVRRGEARRDETRRSEVSEANFCAELNSNEITIIEFDSAGTTCLDIKNRIEPSPIFAEGQR